MIFEFLAPCHPWSINAERNHHWSWRAEKAKLWREAAFYAWKQNVPKDWAQAKCRMTVTLPVRDSRRRDPSNFSGACKAIGDGMVDAGAWPDDTAEWLVVGEITLIPRKDGMVSVSLEEL